MDYFLGTDWNMMVVDLVFGLFWIAIIFGFVTKDEKIIIVTVKCNMIDLFISNFCRQYQEDQESNQKNQLFIPFLLGPPLKNE